MAGAGGPRAALAERAELRAAEQVRNSKPNGYATELVVDAINMPNPSGLARTQGLAHTTRRHRRGGRSQRRALGALDRRRVVFGAPHTTPAWSLDRGGARARSRRADRNPKNTRTSRPRRPIGREGVGPRGFEAVGQKGLGISKRGRVTCTTREPTSTAPRARVQTALPAPPATPG